MTTIHSSPPNMVPTIPSGTLPQTPASEWAEGMNDLLGGHVTRTPVGTPGPPVPGGFPSHLEPDPQPSSGGAENEASVNSPADLLASAQAYLPSLATAKAYLPQRVAAYLPSSETLSTPASESSLPPLPPSSASLSSSSTLPRQDTPASITVQDPAPNRAPTGDSAALSTTVHTGHSSAIPPPSPSPSPQSATAPRPTSGLLPAHPGVAREYSASSLTSTLNSFPPPPAPPVPHVSSSSLSSSPSEPKLVQSPEPLTPSASTDLALAADSSRPPPPGSELAESLARESETSKDPRPRATSGLLPSHPAVAAAPGDGTSEMHALPTSALEGTVHPNPHALPSSDSVDASTPSLVPSTGGDSGYAASTETESVVTPGSGHPFSPMETPGLGGFPAYSFAAPGAHGAGAGADVQGSAALNYSRLADNVPTGDFDAPVGEGDAPRVQGQGQVQGGVGLNSSRLADNLPTGDFEAGAPAVGDDVLSSSAVDAEDEADADADGEDEVDGEVDGEGETTRTKGKSGKKPKLMQRLKEKMHVGGGGSA